MKILEVLWYALPSFTVCGVPIILARFHILDVLGIPISEKFGSNKTWRGLLSGMISAIVVTAAQVVLYTHFPVFRRISVVNYLEINPVALGLLFGIGNHAFDLTKSFFKRRMNKPPGDKFFPWDEFDAFAGVLMSTLMVPLPLDVILWSAIIIPSTTYCGNVFLYHLRVKSVPY